MPLRTCVPRFFRHLCSLPRKLHVTHRLQVCYLLAPTSIQLPVCFTYVNSIPFTSMPRTRSGGYYKRRTGFSVYWTVRIRRLRGTTFHSTPGFRSERGTPLVGNFRFAAG